MDHETLRKLRELKLDGMATGVEELLGRAPPHDMTLSELVGTLVDHDGLSSVHAAHLPTGELIMFHGQSEERVWPIGSSHVDMRWHPVPYTVPTDRCNVALPPLQPCYANVFCSGHVVLPDGRFLVAGGNVTGRGSGGGLVEMFSYSPRQRDGGEWILPDQEVFPFGWSEEGEMAVDRWYPTLTVLPNGYVLISSGDSLVGDMMTPWEGRNTFELFKPGLTPNSGTVVSLDILLETRSFCTSPRRNTSIACACPWESTLARVNLSATRFALRKPWTVCVMEVCFSTVVALSARRKSSPVRRVREVAKATGRCGATSRQRSATTSFRVRVREGMTAADPPLGWTGEASLSSTSGVDDGSAGVAASSSGGAVPAPALRGCSRWPILVFTMTVIRNV